MKATAIANRPQLLPPAKLNINTLNSERCKLLITIIIKPLGKNTMWVETPRGGKVP